MDAKKRYWRTISTITYGPDGSCLSSTPEVREEYDPEEEERRRAAEPVGDRVTYVYAPHRSRTTTVQDDAESGGGRSHHCGTFAYDLHGAWPRTPQSDAPSGGDPPPGPAG